MEPSGLNVYPLAEVGFLFIIIAIILLVLGISIILLGSKAKVEWGGGVVIFIGPFPIVIGGGKLGWLAILIAVLLAFTSILLIIANKWVR